MGPVRHRRLINGLSMVVALQLAVALVALATRAGRDIGAESPAVSVEQAPRENRSSGSVLAGAKIEKRRGTRDPQRTVRQPPSTTAPTAAVPTTGAPAAAPPAPVTPPADPVPSTRPDRSRETAAPPVESTTTTRAAAPGRAPTAAAATPTTAGDQVKTTTLTDPAGDTVADGTGAPVSDPRGDIVRGGVAYGPQGVTFALQVAQPVDPRTDERWAADSTYAQWEVDTNGDSAPDFEVQYYVIGGENLGGSVSKAGDGGETVCDIHGAEYRAEGYWITVDPACLGNPASVSVRATLFYDTNPADENATVVTDTAPNGGWSFPVARPS